MILDEPEVESLSELRKKTNPSSLIEDVKATNPDFPKPGSTDNCVFCAATYEMRRREYDVEARKSMDAHSASSYIDWFKGVQPFSLSIDNIKKDWHEVPIEDRIDGLRDGIKSLSTDNTNARGAIVFDWYKLGYGHIINWELENEVVRFIDSQTGAVGVEKYFDIVDPESIRLFRLDNLEPTDSVVKTLTSRRGK